MNHVEIAQLKNTELREHLKEKGAPLLDMDTRELDVLFAQSLLSYATLRRVFEDAPFCNDLYTSQKKFPSFAYKESIKNAEVPHGSGKAPDILHLAFRKLGLRIANVFAPAIQELIGDESRIRIREGDAIIKDRPPSDEAKQTLNDVAKFTAHFTDKDNQVHSAPVQNGKTHVFENGPRFSVLETALAIREQSIAVGGGERSIETFQWVREVFHLQSLETIIQTQNILRSAIEKHLPNKTLEDFRLTVEEGDLLKFARAVFERSHDAKKDHALHQIAYPQTAEIYRSNMNSTEHTLVSVGESADGFEIQNPKDLASTLYVMPHALENLRYFFKGVGQAQASLPEDKAHALRSLANDVYNSNLEQGRELVRANIHLLDIAMERQEESEAAASETHENYVPELGMRKAVQLIRDSVL